MRKRVVLPPLVILAVVAAAVLVLSPTTKAITGGQPDGNQHPYVGMVTDQNQVCSGSLVDPTRFITAAHCFAESGQRVQVTVHPDGPFADDPGFVDGTWYPHPEYCSECISGDPAFSVNDIAVVILDQPVNVERYAQIPGIGVVDGLADGQEVTVVGYGTQEFEVVDGVPQQSAAFTRFFAEIELVADNPVSGRFIQARAAPEMGPAGACFGDSGGPMLIDDVLLAVNSFVTSETCDGDTFAHRVDLSDTQAFLAQFLL